jgi:eukaryotic-like serine/threonine-protein kinase
MSSGFTRIGRYELLEPLGQGRAFEAFKARSFGVEGFEKKLVVKRVRKELSRDPHFVATFVEEAQRAVRLSHANVVQVFDLGQDDDPQSPQFFMATEYVPGMDYGSLLEAMRQAQPVPVALAVYVAAEVAKALDYAHRRRDEEFRSLNIVHGALSAGNVLLSWDGDVKLSDFGMSRPLLAANPVVTNQLEGLYAVLSPEQALGQQATSAGDVFSLGLLLYASLTGKNPFLADSAKETLVRLSRADAPALSEVRADVPRELSDLVARAMARQPEDRTRDASVLFEELTGVLYTLGSFSAVELSELLARFRGPPSLPPSELGALVERPLSMKPDVPGDAARPSLPPLAAFADTRHVTALTVRVGAGVLAGAVAARVRDLLGGYGADIHALEAGEIRALFGLEQSDGLDSETAVHAGLALTRVLGGRGAGMRAAIAIGRVQRGGEADGAATLYEQASALLPQAEERLIVAPDAVRHLRGRFELEPVERGFVVTRPARPSGAWDRFVGRRVELAALAEELVVSARGALRTVALLGDQGLGKSRLVDEVRRRLARGPSQLASYSVSCPPRGPALQLSGTAAMIRRLCGVSEGDPPERIDTVVPRLRALGLDGEEVEAVLGLLGASRPAELLTTGGKLRGTVTRMFASLARDRLHLLVWDDAQNLDEASVELIRGLIGALGHERLVFVLSGRLEPSAPFRTLPFDRQLVLGEFDPADARRFIAARLGVEEDRLPQSLVESLVERAGGHPMFIEELVRSAVDMGAVVVEDGAVAEFEPERMMGIPRTLLALVAGRLHRIAGIPRDVVVASTVLGAPASTAVIAGMLKVELAALDHAVDDLERAGLVKRTSATAFVLSSPFMREVILTELDDAAIAELHLHAAEAYQSVFADQIEEEAARVGYHLAAAGHRDRAADMYATSGLHHLSERRLEYGVAELVYALDLADLSQRSGPQIGNWVRALSSAVRHVRTGPDLPGFVSRLAGAVGACAHFDRRIRVQITIDLAMILGAVDAFSEAEAILEASAAEAEQWPQAARARLAARGEMAAEQGQVVRALSALGKAAQLRPGDAVEQHRILMATAYANALAGEHAEAEAAFDRAEAIAPPKDLVLGSERRRIVAWALYCEGRYGEAAEAAHHASLDAEDAGLTHEAAAAKFLQGIALLRSGDAARARALVEAAETAAVDLGVERLTGQCRMVLGYLRGMGDRSASSGEVAEGLATAERRGWTADVLLGRWLLARLLESWGETAAAKRELTAAVALARQSGNRVVAADCEAELERLG